MKQKKEKKERQVWPERTFLKELFLKQKKRLDKQHGLGRSRASSLLVGQGAARLVRRAILPWKSLKNLGLELYIYIR